MQIINDNFQHYGFYHVATHSLGRVKMQAKALTSPTCCQFLPIANREILLENKKSRFLLKVKYDKGIDHCLIDMVNAMIRYNIIVPQAKSTTGCTIF